MTGYGIIRMIKPILVRLGLFSSFFETHMLAFDTQGRKLIGNSLSYNAYVTPFYYFYLDFGYLGVILFSFIYGFVCIYILNKINRKCTPLLMAIYMFVLFGLFTSMIRFQFVFFVNVIGIIYIWLVFGYKRNNSIE